VKTEINFEEVMTLTGQKKWPRLDCSCICVRISSPQCKTKRASAWLENVAAIRYLGTLVTTCNYIHEITKSKLNAGYHSVQNILSSCLSKNQRLKLSKNIILPYVLYRLCGLVVRVSGYRSRGPGFDSQRFQIF
jgi:hypothetical protein